MNQGNIQYIENNETENLKKYINTLYKEYNYLNLTIEQFEKLCIDICSNNENLSYEKTINLLQICLDKYVKKTIKEPKKLYQILNNFINNNITVTKEITKNLKEFKKINAFFAKYEIEENPELYSELLNNQIIDEIISKIVDKKQEQIKTSGLTTIDNNHSIQLLLEMYCEKKQIDFENEYSQIIKEEYDIDINANEKDSFGIYLTEIAKPLLTKEEEQRLFVLKDQGDQKAKEKLIEHNLKLVVHVAKSYVGKGLDILDLVQEGNFGLINAIEKFDYKKGYKLSTYATWWIRQSIQRGLMNTAKTIRMPVHLQEKTNKYCAAVSQLTMKLKRQPTKTEICEELNITIEQLNELEMSNQDVVSINTIVGDQDDSDTELIDLIVTEEDSIEQEILKNLITDEIRKMFNQVNLSDREKLIIIERNGLNTGKTKTLSEIANILGITRERVRQIEEKALRKIRMSPYIKNLASLTNNTDKIRHNNSKSLRKTRKSK